MIKKTEYDWAEVWCLDADDQYFHIEPNLDAIAQTIKVEHSIQQDETFVYGYIETKSEPFLSLIDELNPLAYPIANLKRYAEALIQHF